MFRYIQGYVLEFHSVVPVILAVLCVCLLSGHVSGQTCNDAIDGWVNGCSVPLGIDFFYKEKFKSACNKHDHCYNCAQHADFHKTRHYCDKQFRGNMKQICSKTKNLFIRGTCNLFADIYFKAVHKLGVFFFEQKPPAYCSAAWVKRCIK